MSFTWRSSSIPTYKLSEFLFRFDQIVIDGIVNGAGKADTGAFLAK